MWTEAEVREHYARLKMPYPRDLVGKEEKGISIPMARSPRPKRLATEPLSGPLDVTLVLWGHCPSKKSNYRVSASGKLISDAETKSQIGILTTQALFQWGQRAPVEHPEVTTTFYIRSGRSDEDGKYVTLMDVLQHAGIIVNDNAAHFNGRKVHEPCVFIEESEERVEIRLVKR
jgi:hypothetical protein